MRSQHDTAPRPVVPARPLNDRPTRLGEPLGVAAAGIAGVAVVGGLVPGTASLIPVCPSVTLFGVFCPLCGGSRSVNALLSGDLGAMVSYNVLAPVLIVLGIWGWTAWTAQAVGRGVPGIPRPRLVGMVLAVTAIVYAVLRNLPGEPWTALAP